MNYSIIVFVFLIILYFISLTMPNQNKVPEPHIGMTFQSHDDLTTYMQNYMQQSKQVYVIRDSLPDIPKYEKKVKLKPDLKFHKIIYHCKHGQLCRKLKSIQRRKKSLKVNCCAKICIRATYDGSLLEIYGLKLDHVGHFDTEIDPVPESRRLTTEQQRTVENAILMQAKRTCIIKQVAESFDKTVTPKDLKNMEAKLKKTSLDEITWLLNYLKEKDARIDILQEKQIFQGIFFTTPNMRVSTKAWGSIIFFDGTYKLLLHSLILILFLVEDSNFLTEISAVAIVRREDIATYTWTMTCFKNHHAESVEKIKYFMCDKNAAQRAAVREVFPNTSLLICAFHTEENFKRCVNSSSLNRQEKESSFALLKKILYAKTEKEYDYYYEKLKKELPECIFNYLNDNWHPIKLEWTCFDVHPMTLGNRTNNRSESLNQKLKDAIKKMSKLSTAIEGFFNWKTFLHDRENQRKIVANFGTSQAKPSSIDVDKYMVLLMNRPFEVVQHEFEGRDYVNFDESLNNENQIFKIASTGRETTPNRCNCSTWVAYNLPCQHIFAVRAKLDMPLYIENLCAERWHKLYTKRNHRVFLKEQNENVSRAVSYTEKVHKTRDFVELKEIKISEILSDLVDVLSCFCGDDYLSKCNLLKELLRSWSKGVSSVSIRKINTLQSKKEVQQNTAKKNVIKNKSNAKLDVPQKRKEVTKMLQVLHDYKRDDQVTFNCKMTVLQKLRCYWLNLDNVELFECDLSLLPINTEDFDISTNNDKLELPEQGKRRGRPKNSLVTNVYKRK